MIREVVGRAAYRSPSMVNGSYGTATDLWSLGILLHRLLIGKEIFAEDEGDAMKEVAIFTKIDFLSSGAWTLVSKDAKDLISKLLTVQENDRMNAEDLLGEKWNIS